MNKLIMNKVIRMKETLNKLILLMLFMFLGVTSVEAQQDSQFTQYMYNTINVNPAYAGSRGVLSVFGMYRAQWVGLDGAPTTSAASIHSPINNSHVGLGLSILKDEIGPSDRKTISADVSYSVQTSDTYKLSFGLKGSASLLNVDYTKLTRYDLNDPRFQNNIDNQFSPNIGAGVYYHSDKLYAGISVPFMLETKHFDDNASSVAKDGLHYYFIGGYVFDLSETTKFKPAFLIKSVKGAPLQADLTANFMFNDKFVVGGAWRWSAAFSGLVGFQVNSNWFIGYTYDADTTKLANYNSGSHEVFLRYEFRGKQEKIVSPRFF
ncbi:type IX secretion system membrane protein PorP/SprF [Flavobacterium sp. 20NA77.7]|uniref:Type IX secretion system membrane protein PorP/SprF n=1 Tax=Flavobacterium nakdongensis TaxID=3073563 RepID=A0ABY9RC92_9FLAO|nr:type IX secretion system membrane protein PorP/SprF [Flavobacterium sp. 20NA77.7]WMW78279.1 type IX secretion system membrane protein PorP/SprF [Flavobacterium sp. 20NA77.7]